MAVPKSRRKPGRLVRIRQLMQDKPPASATFQDLKDYVRKMHDFLDQMAANQDDLNRYEWFRYDSLPGQHGPTHTGGDDNIIGSGTPTPIALGADGDRGDPHSGAAAADHVHGFDLSPGELDPSVISGDPNPPFLTLAQQLEWHNAQVTREYMYRPLAANTWS